MDELWLVAVDWDQPDHDRHEYFGYRIETKSDGVKIFSWSGISQSGIKILLETKALPGPAPAIVNRSCNDAHTAAYEIWEGTGHRWSSSLRGVAGRVPVAAPT